MTGIVPSHCDKEVRRFAASVRMFAEATVPLIRPRHLLEGIDHKFQDYVCIVVNNHKPNDGVIRNLIFGELLILFGPSFGYI